MGGVIPVVKALVLVITFLNSIVTMIYRQADDETRKKLDAVIEKAKTAKTDEEAADAASKINDSF